MTPDRTRPRSMEREAGACAGPIASSLTEKQSSSESAGTWRADNFCVSSRLRAMRRRCRGPRTLRIVVVFDPFSAVPWGVPPPGKPIMGMERGACLSSGRGRRNDHTECVECPGFADA